FSLKTMPCHQTRSALVVHSSSPLPTPSPPFPQSSSKSQPLCPLDTGDKMLAALATPSCGLTTALPPPPPPPSPLHVSINIACANCEVGGSLLPDLMAGVNDHFGSTGAAAM